MKLRVAPHRCIMEDPESEMITAMEAAGIPKPSDRLGAQIVDVCNAVVTSKVCTVCVFFLNLCIMSIPLSALVHNMKKKNCVWCYP